VKIVEYLSRKSRATFVVIGLVLVAYIGALDYVTGTIALLVFYLVPTCFVAVVCRTRPRTGHRLRLGGGVVRGQKMMATTWTALGTFLERLDAVHGFRRFGLP
jgi:cytochrome c-type biogenesis protein CcmE